MKKRGESEKPWYLGNLRRMMTGWVIPDYDQLEKGESRDEDWEELKKIVNEKLDARAIVDQLCELPAQVFYFHAKSHSGNVWYQAEVGHKYSALGERDFVAELVNECRNTGIVPVCMFQVSTDRRAAEEHPDWLQLDTQGQPSRFLCVNNPDRRAYILAQIKEIVSKYDIGGLMFDEFNMGAWVQSPGCYCPHCQKLFREKFGHDLPKQENWDDPWWQKFVLWRYQVVAEFLREANELIKEIKPEVPLTLISYARSYKDWTSGQSSELCARHLDYLSVDIENTLKLSVTAREFRAFSQGRPELIISGYLPLGIPGRSFSDDLIAKPAATYLPEAMTVIANGLSFGIDICYPPIPLEPGSGVWNASWTKMSQDIMREIERREEWLEEGVPIRYAAVLYSENSRDFYGRSKPQLYQHEYLGLYQALLQKQVIFDIIGEKDLSQEELTKYQVLVLPNAACLSDSQIEQILEYVRKGGGLVATYQTSLYNEFGARREDFGLAEAYGIHYLSGAETDFDYCRDQFPKDLWRQIIVSYLQIAREHPATEGIPAGEMFAWPSPALKTELVGSARMLGNIRWETRSPFPAPHHRRYGPTCPGIVVSQYGKGNVVWFASKPGTLYGVNAHPHAQRLLVNAVRWAAREEPSVMVEAPLCVEVTAFHQPERNRMIIHLVNHQSAPIRFAPLAGCSNPSVREILPVHDIAVEIRLPQGRQVARAYLAPEMEEVDFQMEGGRIRLQVPKLEVHRMVVIEAK